ncbi:hypothetical protein [Algoriphagus sp.]|uniref:hypothetical protein n=1 Tax=Algoriphagus sp. TaxID=1872435 RepID=UPI0025E7F9C4|nr:hypothetical protein [Algoriphagus sp.]
MKKIALLLFLVTIGQSINAQDFPLDSIFSDGIPIKTVNSVVLNEMSGLAFSKLHQDLVYVHNDSGGEPVVYILDSLGNVLGEIELLGTKNRDWEDIAVGPGKDGQSSIYVGDIGDNSAQYEYITVLRLPEPIHLKPSMRVPPEKINLRFPDGPMDAETLMVDPLSGDIFIVSKRDKQNTLFRLPADKFEEGEAVLEEVMKLPITSSVGGDISQDGAQIIIKNYLEVYYWQRIGDEEIGKSLSRNPFRLPYVPEPQGEAVGFTPAGEAFYTISEVRFEIQPVLYRYPKK